MASSDGVDSARMDSTGPALLLFQADTRFTDQRVTEYELQIDGGLDQDTDGKAFTQAARWAFANYYGTPVATAGRLTLLATHSLDRALQVRGRTVTPVETGSRTLDPSVPAHRSQLTDLVQADLRNAIPDADYEFRFLNDIRRVEPAFVAESGDFAAHLTYTLSVEMTADGVPLLNVEVGHTLRALTTLDERLTPGESFRPIDAEHDPRVYATKGSGRVTGWADQQYTDPDPDLGASIAEVHEGDIDEELRARLIDENPRLLTVEYGSTEGKQLPHVLTMTPSLGQVKTADYDFHRRFQTEKALQPGERYRYAVSFLEALARLPTLNTSFIPKPTPQGYEQHTFRQRTRPRLVYGDGERGDQPREDLPAHGVYEAPEYHVRLISPSTDAFADIREVLPRFIARRLGDIEAPARVTGGETYDPGDTVNYTRAASALDTDTDVALVVVPDAEQAANTDLFEDPFPEIKRRLMRRGIPTQMVTKSTADRLIAAQPPASEPTVANILSGIATKAGATPWMVAEFPGDVDAFLGLDVSRKNGRNAGASASVVLPDGATFAAEFTTFQDGETFRAADVSRIVRDLVFDFAGEAGHSIDHLTVLRDGKIYEDVETIREGLAAVDISVDLVGVRKSGQPRVGHWTGDGWRIADKGVAFVAPARDRAVLHSWGMPDCNAELATGSPQTIGLRKDSGPTDITTLTEQAYWLSEMHYGSPARSGRLPIPIEYADQAAEYVREGYADPNSIINGPAYL